jgi:hypothetical protein
MAVKCKLQGEDGNGLAIITRVAKALKQAGVPADVINQYRDRAMSADYNSLINESIRVLNEAGVEYEDPYE